MEKRMFEELNAAIPPVRPLSGGLRELVWKLKQYGWEEWEKVAFDPETGGFEFFRSKDELERYLSHQAAFLIEDMDSSNKCMSSEDAWLLAARNTDTRLEGER